MDFVVCVGDPQGASRELGAESQENHRMIQWLEIETWGTFGITQPGEENVRCYLLALFKYGLNIFHAREVVICFLTML